MGSPTSTNSSRFRDGRNCGRWTSSANWTRREWLGRIGSGFGGAALSWLLTQDALAKHPSGLHFPARAKRIIWLFMGGGPSHVDTFDPKPLLQKYNRQVIPVKLPAHLRDTTKKLLASPFKFKPRGNSGIPVSDLLPEMAQHADDLCVIRSMHCDSIDHTGATLQSFTGMVALPRPGLGCWLLYGLGTENDNLPGYVVLGPDQQTGTGTYNPRFLPSKHQGTRVEWRHDHLLDAAKALPNLRNAARLSRQEQRNQLQLLKLLNEKHARARDNKNLEARIASFELAFRMQISAPEAFEIHAESAATHKLYGLDNKKTRSFGTRCLLARRMAERGVRFVQVQCGKGDGLDWDQHFHLERDHRRNAAATDKPVAGLLQDLKQRGLLQDTLVIWGGEFGRSPTSQGTNGREHHPHGYTLCLCGGGVKGGFIHGGTDDFGWYSIDKKVHVHDFHATLLHLMGIDHKRLTYRYSGRDFRLTDVHGNVVHDLMT